MARRARLDPGHNIQGDARVVRSLGQRTVILAGSKTSPRQRPGWPRDRSFPWSAWGRSRPKRAKRDMLSSSAGGVFDLLHMGHVRHLEAARRYGDILIVTITADLFVDERDRTACIQSTAEGRTSLSVGICGLRRDQSRCRCCNHYTFRSSDYLC